MIVQNGHNMLLFSNGSMHISELIKDALIMVIMHSLNVYAHILIRMLVVYTKIFGIQLVHSFLS